MHRSVISAYLSCVLLMPAEAGGQDFHLQYPVQPGALLQVNARPGRLLILDREGQSSFILMARASTPDSERIAIASEIDPPAEHAAEDGPQQLLALIIRYAHAQSTFDVEGLKATTDSTFIEVSPIGEVDSREKVLAFYASSKNTAGPTLKIDDQNIRIFSNTGVVIARMTYSLKGPDGQERQQALRACYVAYKHKDKWKLISAQYTPIRQR